MARLIEDLQALLQASAADPIRLAWMENPSARAIRGLDLRLLAEYERKPGGAVRVKFIDRAALLAAAARSEALFYDDDDSTWREFIAAIEGKEDGADE